MYSQRDSASTPQVSQFEDDISTWQQDIFAGRLVKVKEIAKSLLSYSSWVGHV